ncbi:MAG: alpha/beta hydrolase [Bacteroidota bacterium]|nr:alpha/beta hydrolase [Bacteroidota bacterium]
MKRLLFLILGLVTSFYTLTAQEEIKLYRTSPEEINGILGTESRDKDDFVTNITDARMYAYLAPKETATGAAVLICPGGGYYGISVEKEGYEIARWFNKLGVSAFVLYYRMPNGHTEIPLKDAQAALQIVKTRTKEWNISKNRIGIMGFSAGGHLASTVGTHFRTKAERPDFMILAYPVVTMKKGLTHGGSRENLLGKNPAENQVERYSNELQVTKKTPPTFIVHAIDDTTVPIANSEQLLKALQDNKIPAELHKFDVGGHGFGMRKRGIPVDNWPELLKTWLKARGLINE